MQTLSERIRDLEETRRTLLAAGGRIVGTGPAFRKIYDAINYIKDQYEPLVADALRDPEAQP